MSISGQEADWLMKVEKKMLYEAKNIFPLRGIFPKSLWVGCIKTWNVFESTLAKSILSAWVPALCVWGGKVWWLTMSKVHKKIHILWGFKPDNKQAKA
jgi:hypothetical protein